MTPLDCMEIYQDAAFYDVEFADRVQEIPFYLERAKRANGPVLEIACGTGRITLPIARAGIDITGVDVSRPMIELARRKGAADGLAAKWVEQDCRVLAMDRDFGLIFSAANAMQHLHDYDSVNLFLDSAKRALRPEGGLIIDVFNPDLAKLARKAEARYLRKTMHDAAGRELRVEATTRYDAASQILKFTLFYMRSGDLVRRKDVAMRCFFPEELAAFCQFNGLEIQRRYGDYDESPFNGGSPKQILICGKVK